MSIITYLLIGTAAILAFRSAILHIADDIPVRHTGNGNISRYTQIDTNSINYYNKEE